MAQLPILTETELANQALGFLRASRIVDLDSDTGRKGRTLKTYFAEVRDSLLRRYEWNFAKTYLSLPAGPDPADWKWAYYYPLPSDCLKVLDVRGCAGDQWEIVGRKIGTNLAPPLDVTVIRRVVEVAQWDALFRRVFTVALAQACAPELAEDENIDAELDRKMQEAWDAATPVDASEKAVAEADPFDYEFIRERYR